MTDITLAPPGPIAISGREIMPWAIFGGLLLLVAFYFISTEEGAVAVFGSMYVHEFVHDARHLPRLSCH